MTRLLVLRHGETDWNAEGRYQGSTDLELNDAGREQAREAAGRLSGAGVQAVASSPLKRARQTADIVAEILGLPVSVMGEFAERSVGVFEGLTPDEARVRHPDLWSQVITRQIHRGPPGGESILDVALRVHAGLRRIRETQAGRTVLLVAHGYVARAVYGILVRPADEEFFRWRAGNGVVAEFDLEAVGPGGPL